MSDPAPWSRRSTAALLVLVIGCAASLHWLTHPWYEATNETYDASMYLLCAKSILAGEGYSVLGMPFTVRPPGFSVLLLPVIAARGLDFLALQIEVGAFGVLAVACLFVLARDRLGDLAASAVALLLWLNPAFRHLSNQVMSDVPGLALALGCLLVARWAERAPSVRRDALLGLCLGLSAYVRTAALLLVAAVLLSRFLARTPVPLARFVRARLLVVPAVAIAVTMPWSIRNAVDHPPGPAEQTLFDSYSTGMWHRDGGDPGSPWISPADLLERAGARIPRILADLGGRLDADASGAFPTILGAAMIAAIAWVAVRRREPAEILALLTLGLLSVYFVHDLRLELPIFALGLVASAEVALAGISRFAGRKAGAAAVAAGATALMLLDFAPRRGWEEIRAAHERDLGIASALRAELAPEERVAAPVGWHWSLLLDRPVYSLYFAGKRAGPAGVMQVIEGRKIDAVIVRTDPDEAPRTLDLLESRFGKRESLGPVAIVRTKR